MEITRKNFSEQYDNITNDLKRSCFVAFDAEFTAILTGDKFKHRIFDTCEQRYNEMKDEISNMIMSQIGLTIFCYERDLDRYVATAYTFHLSPQVIGDIDQKFIFQASTLQFLCRYNFNFNKFIYEGLPYLSESEERSIRQQLREKTLCTNILTALPMEDEKLLQNHCSEVSKWLINSTEDTMYIDIDSPLLRYILHNEIRNRFPEVLTTDSLGNSHKVLIYRNKEIEGAINAASEILEENVINHLLGFSHIIKLLANYQKPIIGHNIFLDTIFLHNQFIGPLPAKYTDFKRNINEMFPALFDTKFISYEMRWKLSFDECWKSNALQDLYEFFSEDKCKRIGKGVNLIKLSTPFDVKQSYHEAGWDSFCTGYCFIRLGHWAACENSGKYRPVSPKEKLAALSQYANKVNVIRGAVPYMNFAGSDPPSNRLKLLHVKTLQERTINVSQVASLLAGFGSIDVKPYGSRSALVAANSQQTVDKILKQFRNSREYSISMYSVYRHAPASRMIMWSGALITGSVMLLLLHKKINA